MYVKICSLLFLILLVFGILGPYLISAPSTEFVVAGFALIVFSLPIIGKLAFSIYEDIRRCIDEKESD